MISALRRPYGWVRHQIGSLIFERRLGVRTSGRVDLESFGLDHEERVFYIASKRSSLRRALRGYPVGETDVFLDLGSGMGRMVLEAAAFPFRRVIGVELVTELHLIAQQNRASYRGSVRCGEIVLVNSDVERYEVPDDVTVVYMFNPFRGSIFATAVEKLIGSVERNPRRLRLIYANPAEEEQLLATGRIRLVDEVVVGRNAAAELIRSYEISPGPANAAPVQSPATETGR